MLRDRLSATQAIAGLTAVAACYIVFFRLNDWLFSVVKVSEHISWIFLPAAVRMLAVLMFGWAGVAGLFIGSLTQLGTVLAADPARAFIIAGLSSLPCLFAARVVQRLLGIGNDLGGMTARQLMLFGLAGGFANSAAHTAYFALSSGSLAPLSGFLPMFVGDTVGTFIMLYAGALLIGRFAGPMTRA